MSSVLIGDIETNAIYQPSRIWMVGVLDFYTDEFTAYVGDDEVPLGLMRLAEADLVCGHNFRAYDAKEITRMTEGLITLEDDRIIDTLEIGRSLFPDLVNHKLKTWGEIFGYPKIDYDKGFDAFHPDMVPYCERDCRLTKAVYEFLLSQS
jgi:hypothetical protein